MSEPLRIAVLTSGPVGNTGNVCSNLTDIPDVEFSCLIYSDESAFRGSRIRRIKKILNIGVLGALNGIRMRSWFASDGFDAREVAAKAGIPVIKVNKVNCAETKQALIDNRIDLGISLCNGYIASWIFSVPRYGFINFHGELLPDFAGAQSIIWPIHEKLTETGFTIHTINKGIDCGDIVYQQRHPINFQPSLEQTVRSTSSEVRVLVPLAFRKVLENWEFYWENRYQNPVTRHFTTPSIWQFIKMVKWNRRRWQQKSQNENFEL